MREGWAAAVGKVYRSRENERIRISEYRVTALTASGSVVREEIIGVPVAPQAPDVPEIVDQPALFPQYAYDATGRYQERRPPWAPNSGGAQERGAVADHPRDLIKWEP